MVFGRHPECDKVLSNPSVSARHARLTRQGDGFLLEDLGSSNGTYVNGQRLEKSDLGEGRRHHWLGTYTFKIDDQGNLEQKNLQGNVTLEVRGITVDVPGKRLIEDVSLTIYPSEFVGLMGPSGAGKTTLMNALNGYTPPTQGQVLINGESLYADYARFAPYIGYVPQDDIIHKDLTVGQALYYNARLRLPPDFTDDEINKRIDGHSQTARTRRGEKRPHRLAGEKGHQRRPTQTRQSGDGTTQRPVDPVPRRADIGTFLARRFQRHEAFAQNSPIRAKRFCLPFINRASMSFGLWTASPWCRRTRTPPEPGRLVYFGPNYPDAVDFFNPEGVPNLPAGMETDSPDEILSGLDRNGKTADWRKRYPRFALQQGIRRRTRRQGGDEQSTGSRPLASGILRRRTILRASSKRCLAIKLADRGTSLMLLVQAPIIASWRSFCSARISPSSRISSPREKVAPTAKAAEAAARSLGGSLLSSHRWRRSSSAAFRPSAKSWASGPSIAANAWSS